MGPRVAILALVAGLTACTRPATPEEIADHETRKRLQVVRVCSSTQTIWHDPLTGDRYMRTIHRGRVFVERASPTAPLEELCPPR